MKKQVITAALVAGLALPVAVHSGWKGPGAPVKNLRVFNGMVFAELDGQDMTINCDLPDGTVHTITTDAIVMDLKESVDITDGSDSSSPGQTGVWDEDILYSTKEAFAILMTSQSTGRTVRPLAGTDCYPADTTANRVWITGAWLGDYASGSGTSSVSTPADGLTTATESSSKTKASQPSSVGSELLVDPVEELIKYRAQKAKKAKKYKKN